MRQVITGRLKGSPKDGKSKRPEVRSCGNVPDANTDVVIENGVTNYPEVSTNISCGTVNINPAASLIVKPGVNLIISRYFLK